MGINRNFVNRDNITQAENFSDVFNLLFGKIRAKITVVFYVVMGRGKCGYALQLVLLFKLQFLS